MKAVVLTGGRKKPLTKLFANFSSRSMASIGGTRLIDHILYALSDFYESIVVVHDDPMIKTYLEENKIGKPVLKLIKQRGEGIENAICSALVREASGLKEPLTIVYGDIYSLENFYQLHAKNYFKYEGDLITATIPYRNYPSFTRLVVSEESRVVDIGRGDYIYAGMLTIADQNKLEQLLCKEKKTLTYYIDKTAKEGKLSAILWHEEWVDIDTPWDYIVAMQYKLSKLKNSIISETAIIKDTAVIEPPAIIENKAFIDHFAVIKGPVYIGRNAFIGAHSFVREYSSILEEAKVGSFNDIKRSILMEESFTSSHVYLSDTIAGQKSVISPFVVAKSIPFSSEKVTMALSFSLKLREIKIGPAISARRKIGEHSSLNAGEIY